MIYRFQYSRNASNSEQLSFVRNKGEDPEKACFLDLYPLYGVKENTSSIRAKDGRGMLSPDCFVDKRAACYPAAVSALLILWNRNHNVYFLPF